MQVRILTHLKPLPVDAQKALHSLGAAIRRERKGRDLSQEKFAELADVHPTYIGKIERAEKNISFENLLRLSAALRLKPSELFDRAGL